MNIAIYYDLPPGGANRTIEAIISRLIPNHSVEIFHSEHHSDNHRFLSDWNALVIQRIKAAELAKKIDMARFDVMLVTHDRFLQAPWILRYLKTPTIFLCQEPTRSYYEFFLRIPDSWPLLNKAYEKINRFFRKRIEETNARQSDRIVSNSLYSAEVLFRSYGRFASPVYLGIDPEEYFDEKRKKKNQIVIVGNDEPQKDLGMAIHSISQIAKNKPKLIVASPRRYNPDRIHDIANRSKVEIKIVFERSVEQMRRIYSESILTLATSYLEPFGLSVIESMACCTPVVAINEGGYRETIIDQKTGFLVERNATALGQACEILLCNPKMAKKMGETGMDYVRENFTWDKTVNQLDRIFKDVSRHHRS